MPKTRFSTGARKDIFLYRTTVENLFINEFLPDAPGDYVKVFIFGLMYAQFGEEIDTKTMALTLGITETDVENAWKYWASKDLVKIGYDSETEESTIEFARQIDIFYGKTIEESYPVESDQAAAEEESHPEESADEIIARLINQQLREIFDKYQMKTGRTMSRHEAGKLTDAVKVYNIEPDVLDFAIDYCVGIDKYSVDYICKVAQRWKEEGCKDVAEVKAMLDRHSRRNDFYRQVFSALGWSRLPAPADREIMDRWFDTMGYSIRDVLEACKASAGLRDPNLRYVNKVLENRMLEKGGINTRNLSSQSRAASAENSGAQAPAGSQAGNAGEQAKVSRKVLRDYFDYIRQEEDRDLAARTSEVCEKLPEMKEIFDKEAALSRALINMAPGEGAAEGRRQLREKRLELEERKKELLESGGYPADHLDRRYKCDICRDSGYTDEGRTCTCCRERAEEAYRWIRNQGKTEKYTQK